MSREVKRVPLDFDWPLKKVWSGYLMPDSLQGDTCKLARMDDPRFSGGCGGGYDGEIHFFVEATRTTCKEQWDCVLGYKHKGDHQRPPQASCKGFCRCSEAWSCVPS